MLIKTIHHDALPGFEANEHYVQSAIVATGALNSGSITSGFGSINVGASDITTTGSGRFGEVMSGDNILAGGEISMDGDVLTIGRNSNNPLIVRFDHFGGLGEFQWSGSQFNFNDSLVVAGTITAEQLTSTDDITMQGHLLTLGDGSATDGVMQFVSAGGTGTLTWDNTDQRWIFNKKVNVIGLLDVTGSIFAGADSEIEGDLLVLGDLTLNDDGDAIDLTLSFVSTGGTGLIKWKDATASFEIGNKTVFLSEVIVGDDMSVSGDFYALDDTFLGNTVGDVHQINGAYFLPQNVGTTDFLVTQTGTGTKWGYIDPGTLDVATADAVAVTDESSDTETFLGFYTAASGDLPGKTNSALKFNASTGELILGGNVTLASTSFASQLGIIKKSGFQFIHDFNYGDNGTVITAGQNIFLGYRSGNFTMGSTATQIYHASTNFAGGPFTLFSNTTGYQNFAGGASALTSNTAGYRNFAGGYFCLRRNTIGRQNFAGGAFALTENVDGNNNFAGGFGALQYTTDGDNNFAGGALAGKYSWNGGQANLTTVNNSIFIGGTTRAKDNSGTNEIVIGFEADGQGSNTVVLGNDSVTDTYLKGTVHAPALEVTNNVGFYGTTPVTQNQLATGVGASVDDVITELQRLGLVRQAA